MQKLGRLEELEPTVFENLVYDLVTASGFANVVWRTPGADGGRDIEASYYQRDAVGEQIQQKWHIECKRYRSSIDWPTVYNKLAHADARSADFLLLATNSNPSPTCESRIQSWNKSREPKIRVWRGYQIDSILRLHPQISVKYGFSSGPEILELAFQPLLFELMKIAQAANAAMEVGQSAEAGLQAAALIGELIQQRISDISAYGSPSFVAPWEIAPEPWISATTLPTGVEEVGFSAFTATLRYITAASSIAVDTDGDAWKAVPAEAKLPISETGAALLRLVAMWTNLELSHFGCDMVRFQVRRTPDA